ncbi:MAG TPA: intradiol ring-cleavage dioxygenase [Gemmatimonadales bacterium]|jgi:protocatechuate 3,4-dioxygenase beta subunit
MNNDDTPRGRLLSRREMLALLGASGAALATGKALGVPRLRAATARLPSCVVRPEQTEGPYFVDERLHRSDIRSDPVNGAVSPGVPLALTFLVSRVASSSCAPLAGAQIDVWQCDALGVYSDVTDRSFTTVGQRFLRGHQFTDAAGRAAFQTIYPGWYPGRAVHIHFKIRTPAGSTPSAEFTSQLYFEDALTDRVHRLAPYVTKGEGRVRNSGDRIYRRGGDQLVLAPSPVGDAYEATFAVGLELG